MFGITISNLIAALIGAVVVVVSAKAYTFVKTKIVAVVEAEAAKIVARAKAPVAAAIADVKVDVAKVETAVAADVAKVEAKV